MRKWWDTPVLRTAIVIDGANAAPNGYVNLIGKDGAGSYVGLKIKGDDGIYRNLVGKVS